MPAGKVAALRQQFQQPAGSFVRKEMSKPDLLTSLKESMDKVQPGLGELFEKEKPIIAELMVKLRDKEHREAEDYSSSMDTSSSSPGASVMSVSSSDSSAENQQLANNTVDGTQPQKLHRRPRGKTPLEKLLADPNTRELFREFIGSRGIPEALEFWEACEECERKARGCASLAKKIIKQLMQEMKETNGKPENGHMELALNSAVVAVRYELLLHKEETHSTAGKITDMYVRDNAPQRVNLSSEKRTALITIADAPVDSVLDEAITCVVVQAQHEILDVMERKFYEDFCREHNLPLSSD